MVDRPRQAMTGHLGAPGQVIQRHNSTSVDFIREDFFGKVSYRIIDLKLCSSRRAFETLRLMIDHKLGRWGAKSVFWSHWSHLNSIILHMRMTLWLNKKGFLLFIRVQKFLIFKNFSIFFFSFAFWGQNAKFAFLKFFKRNMKCGNKKMVQNKILKPFKIKKAYIQFYIKISQFFTF